MLYFNKKRGSIVGNLDDLMELVKAFLGNVDFQNSNVGNSIAIGIYDEERSGYWYGGCDPSNFLNPSCLGKKCKHYNPEQKCEYTDCDIYEWRINYPKYHVFQALSSLVFKNEIKQIKKLMKEINKNSKNNN